MSRLGLISIGTNSTRALVADIAENQKPAVLLHRAAGTRLGEGLKEHGRLDEAAAQRTLDAIREHAAAIRELTDDVQIIATSALRRADDCDQFASRVRELTGVELHVISGEEEARCSFTGAVCGLDGAAEERFAVVDVGGGSTEYAAGTRAGAEQFVSCEIGAVRLTESVPQLSGERGPTPHAALAEAQHRAREALASIRSFALVNRLVFVGGSATNTAAILRESRDGAPYEELRRDGLHSAIEKLAKRNLKERRALPGMNPQRADILLAGELIMDSVLEATQREAATVSENDLLLGFLIRTSPP